MVKLVANGMSRKRARSTSPSSLAQPATATAAPATAAPATAASPNFFSAPIEDRSSHFIAVYSPTASAKSLQAHPDFSTATHRIAAWRTLSKQRSIYPGAQRLYETGHDDDGEKYAGKKLETLLENMKAEGAVVVARRYGGIMLGPVRFTHIEHCARDAILRSRQIEAQVEQAKKKQRTADEDENTRVSLARTLQERDQSITVLRALLVEKTVGASAEPGEKVTGAQHPTPTKQIDYSAMPLQALKQIDKARDATIAWILKKIDEAEEEQAKVTPTSPLKTTAELHNKSDGPS